MQPPVPMYELPGLEQASSAVDDAVHAAAVASDDAAGR